MTSESRIPTTAPPGGHGRFLRGSSRHTSGSSGPRTPSARTYRGVAMAAVVLGMAAMGIGGTGVAGASPAPSDQVDLCGQAAVGYARCFAVAVRPPAGQAQPNTPQGYGPADLQSAYKLPSATVGTGRKVAIVDAFDDPNAEADLATYRSTYGLAPCTTANGCFHKVNQSGAAGPYPPASAGWAGEISLDLDMVSATCPKCSILLVETNDNNLGNLAAGVNTAASLGATTISNSYGSSEWSGETAFDGSYHHPGIPITVSTGDSGYGTAYPAASRFVTAVGGTSLSTAANARGWSETAWAGAGSGCSSFEAKPTWQHDTGCARRTMADVSAVADPATGVAVYDSYPSGGWAKFGGTSASAPIVASVYAMAAPDVRSAAAQAYYRSSAASVFDVTSGSNGSCGGSYLCTAVTGFDGPTGLGSPHGVPADSWAYVWANQPSSASYTPSSLYSANSAGLTNTITRSGVGSYAVHFPGMAQGGTVDVTSYSNTGNCHVGSWFRDSVGQNVSVYCYAPGGAAQDSYFTASFTAPAGSPGTIGYVWANLPTSASYTPSSLYQFNSTGANNTITRSGVGVYQVQLPGLGSYAGTVKVTAYGSGSQSCSVTQWGSGTTVQNVNVACVNAAGAPVDAYFTATYTNALAFTGRAGAANAYLWANQPSSASYTPSASYSYNSTGGTNTITRSAPGTYTLSLPNLGGSNGDVQVTGYGAATQCRVLNWYPSGTTQLVNIGCTNMAGTATDSYFQAAFTR